MANIILTACLAIAIVAYEAQALWLVRKISLEKVILVIRRVKRPSKRPHGNSKVNQKLIDSLKMADAYDNVEYFDSGPDVRAAISLATANSVNKYHMIPLQQQAEYNKEMKELSKHSVNIALPDDYEDEEGVFGSGDEEDGSGGDPGRNVNNNIGL